MRRIDGDYVYWYNLSPNTNYVLCAVAYSMKGSEKQWGKMTMKRVTSKSTATNFDVHIGTITYNSTKWNYTFNKDSRCHHFYSMVVTNNYAEILSSYPDIALAKFIKDLIKSSSTYDYILNDGSYYYERTSTDYALLVWAWGVSDTGNFSNNLSRQYKNLSSSSSECLANSQQLNGEPKKWKLPLEEWKEILKNVRVNYQ